MLDYSACNFFAPTLVSPMTCAGHFKVHVISAYMFGM